MKLVFVLVLVFISLLGLSLSLFIFSIFYSVERGISISALGFISSFAVGLIIITYLIINSILQVRRNKKMQ